jgi:hypothetical protein
MSPGKKTLAEMKAEQEDLRRKLQRRRESEVRYQRLYDLLRPPS